jgi:O-antigen ligase
VAKQLIYLLFKKKLEKISFNIVDLLTASLLFYCLINILVNRDWGMDKYIIYKWSAVILCYIFFRNYHYSRLQLLIACCISGLFQSFIAIYEKRGILASRNITFDVTGSFNNPGPLGGYIAVCCAITMGLLFHAIRNKRHHSSCFISVALFIQLYGLYLTESRAAILSLVPGLIWISHSTLMKMAGKKKKLLLTIIGSVLIVGGLFLYRYKPASADGRLLIWRVSADMIADAPLFGHGIDGFSKEYMIYQANYFKENPTSYFTSVADNVVYPFNEFIHIWILYGIAGLLPVMLLLWFTFVNSDKKMESNIMKAGLSSLLIFSFFSYPFAVFPLLLFYPFLCGSIHSKIYYRFRITNLKGVFMLLIIAVLIIQTSKDILFLRSISCSLSTLYERDGADMNHVDYEKIKGNINFNDYYATWLVQQSETGNERLKDMYPSCETYCLLGNYHVERKDYKLAEYYFQEASFMIPTRLRPKYNLWELYKDTGQTEKALEMANSILTMKLKIESAYTLRMKRKVKDYYKDTLDNLFGE